VDLALTETDLVAIIVWGGLVNMQFTFASTFLDIINQPGMQDDIITSLKDATAENLNTFERTPPWAKLRSAMFESIRLSGPISGPARLIMQDTPLVSDPTLRLPKGQAASISAYYSQRDESLWGETAKVYRPERFLNADPPIGMPGYIIWGLKGPHTCPGRWFGQAIIQVMTKTLITAYTFAPDKNLLDGDKYVYAGGLLKRVPVAAAVRSRGPEA
jgi:peroxidase